MNLPSIRDIINEWSPIEGGTLDTLEQALVDREQDRMDALAQVALGFGVMSPILAMVMVNLELGRPRSDEEKAFIEGQFQTLQASMQQQASEHTGLPPESFTFPSTTPPEVSDDDTP